MYILNTLKYFLILISFKLGFFVFLSPCINQVNPNLIDIG